eukprot:m.273679 g.273679  ORF g.273679 m.273679 type:complete len:450 (-) comp16282_c7_seq1:145-1494(-)
MGQAQSGGKSGKRIQETLEQLGRYAEPAVRIYGELEAKAGNGTPTIAHIHNNLQQVPINMLEGMMRKIVANEPAPNKNLNTLTKERFLSMVSELVSNGVERKALMYFAMIANPDTPDTATAKQIEALLTLGMEKTVPDASQEREALLHHLRYTACRKRGRAGALGEENEMVTSDTFVSFLEGSSIGSRFLDKLVIEGLGLQEMPPFGFKLPQESSLLGAVGSTFLHGALPEPTRDQWTRIFHSKLHGGSFSAVRREILEAGSTLMIIRDKGGAIFGGYAHENWKQNPDFYGSDKCFLFSIHPRMEVYRPSGLNENFLYFNFGMETLPNGLGMGGQLEYFGFFISSNLESAGIHLEGICRADPLSTTYNSPVLSTETSFQVEEMEVWRIGPVPELGIKNKPKAMSILNERKEDQVILELAGKKMHAKDLPEMFEEDEVKIVNGKVKRPVY